MGLCVRIALMAVWCLPAVAPAQSGLPFLRLGAGARSAGLADAATALPDVDAAATNPAALQTRGIRTVSVTHSPWIQETRQDRLSLVFSGSDQAWGIAGDLTQANDLARRTGPTSQPLGTFGVYDGVLSLTHARFLTSRLRAGASIKLLRQSIAVHAATGVAVDLGLLQALGEDLDIGIAARNLGRMSDLQRAPTPLPRSLRLGLAYGGLPRLLLSGDVERTRSVPAVLHVGAEVRVHDLLALRGGYQTADTRTLSAGVGLAAGPWTVDYAFIPFDSDLGEAHRLSVQLYHRVVRP